MIRPPRSSLAAMLGLLVCTAAFAQDKPPAVTPLKLQVVISRYQGEKKVSSLPYTLSINASSKVTGANLRMGTRIPIMMMAGQPKEDNGKPLPQVGPVQYQDVGTNIDCTAATLDDGRFSVTVAVDDSSVYAEGEAKTGASSGQPSFRSFRVSNSTVLKDGQSVQFTTATDKLTSETMRIEVMLTVVK